MRPRITLLAAALLLPMAAHAELSLNHRGTGQALYLPYYTVENGQSTLLTLANTRDEAKAVRVNIVEARNGQKVLSFNVFLAPRDSWTMAIGADPAGEGAMLHSNDGSCTVPAIPAAGVAFVNFDYAANFDDGGPYGLDRTRTGAIELIEMGVPGGELGEAVDSFDCTALRDASVPGGAWDTDPDTDMGAPTGGLAASVDVVDVPQGLVFNLPAVAIDGFADVAHFNPSGSSPMPRISNPIAPEGGDFSVRLDDGTTVTVDAARAPDAVSALFMAGALLGDVHNEASLGASTDWILSFPTKHAYVFDVPGSLVDDDGPAVAPFSQRFSDGQSCTTGLPRLYTMSGGEFQGEVVLDPAPPIGLCLQVLRLPTAELESGRMELHLPNAPGLTVGSGEDALRLSGLPVVGFRLSRFVNGQAQPGVLANYTVSQPLASRPPLRSDP